MLGFILALGAGFITFMFLQNAAGNQAAAPVETQPVVVALQPVDSRSAIPPDAVGIQDWPVTLVPPGALTDTAQVAGKLTVGPVFPGQVIVQDMIVDKEQLETQPAAAAAQLGSDLSYTIPEGMVATAFPVTEISSVAGAIKPGDRVDLIITVNLPEQLAAAEGGGGVQNVITGLTLQNLEVINTVPWGVEAEGAQVGGQIYTLLVNREQASILKFIRENAQPDFVLRPAGDTEEYEVEPITLEYILTNFNLLPNQ
ncbi:MAG: Flp pilus assembly protein CpaB [Ardenticatenia bacterium]|nr:Flp pilus assembly protein CpaB [Ardenticatenia bacterium]